jgi:hypothetical protein
MYFSRIGPEFKKTFPVLAVSSHLYFHQEKEHEAIHGFGAHAYFFGVCGASSAKYDAC